MKLPNWFKILWWAMLVTVLTAFLVSRYPDLKAGKAASADVVVFVIWIALLLAPLFSQISLLGITLKQDIAELRSFVAAQVNDVRSEVRNAIDVRTTFSPTIHIPAASDDARLTRIEPLIRRSIAEALSAHAVHSTKPGEPLKVTEDVAMLFAARYSIESELRRLFADYKISTGVEPPSRVGPGQMLEYLSKYGILETGLVLAVREVLAVCNLAIHAQPVTAAQASFVRDLAPGLVTTLQAIKQTQGD